MSKRALTKINTFLEKTKNNEELLSFLKDLAYSNEPTNRTIASRFSLFKKHIRDNYPSYPDNFLSLIAPPKELTQSIINADKEVRNAKVDIKFDQDLIDKILQLKNSSNVYDRFVYLQFASGRRISEIFESTVKAVPKKSDIVKMQLSKKKDEDKFFNVELIKDTNSVEFRKMLSSAKKSLTGMSLGDFTNRLNKRIRDKVRNDLSSHSLRGLYAVFRYHKENPDNQNMIGYISRVLNHGLSSESGVAYSNYDFVQ